MGEYVFIIFSVTSRYGGKTHNIIQGYPDRHDNEAICNGFLIADKIEPGSVIIDDKPQCGNCEAKRNKYLKEKIQGLLPGFDTFTVLTQILELAQADNSSPTNVVALMLAASGS